MVDHSEIVLNHCFMYRTPEYLAQSIAMSRAEGYALGVKLVRGAYHPHEIEIHKAATSSRAEATTPSGSHDLSISPDNLPPVWLYKDETDSCYDSSVRLLISLLRQDVDACAKGAPGPTVGALFGTHNWDSADLVIDELVKQGLAAKDGSGVVTISEAAMERVAVAQLYGGCQRRSLHVSQRLTERYLQRHGGWAYGPPRRAYSRYFSLCTEVPAVWQAL